MTTSAFSTEPVPTSSTDTGHPSVRSSNRVLRGVFAFDRAFAASSALVLTLASPILANVLDWPTMVVAAIGLALAPYAFLLHHVYRSTRLRSGLAKFTAGGDAAWVVASIVLLLGWPDATSTVGKWLIAAAAVVVTDIGLTKLYGWSRPNDG